MGHPSWRDIHPQCAQRCYCAKLHLSPPRKIRCVQVLIPGSRECGLIWKEVACGYNYQLRWLGCLSEHAKEDSDTGTKKRRRWHMMMMKAETEVMELQTPECRAQLPTPEARRYAWSRTHTHRVLPPQAFHGASLLNTLILASQFPPAISQASNRQRCLRGLGAHMTKEMRIW